MTFRAVLDNDFKAMLNGEFSESVIVSNGTNSATVKGIYDKTYQVIDPDTNVVMMSSKPRVTIWEADVAFQVKQGHSITARNRTYTIRELQREGEGAVTLYLD